MSCSHQGILTLPVALMKRSPGSMLYTLHVPSEANPCVTSSSTTAKTHSGSSPFGSPPPNGHHADVSHQISCRTTEKPPSRSSCFCTFFLQSPPPSGLLYLLRNLNTQGEVQLLTRAHKHDPPLHPMLTPLSISYYAPVTWAIFRPLRIPKIFFLPQDLCTCHTRLLKNPSDLCMAGSL